jgi:molecular chaperone GrpE
MEEKNVKNAANTQKAVNGSEAATINADSDVPRTEHLSNPLENISETEKLQQELAELKDKYIRQIAEFDNFRKRSAKERMELMQTAGKEVITSLLDVLDDCDRAQKQLDDTENLAPVIKEGILLIFNKLRNIMQVKGLKTMDVLHQDFNADLHEAITEMPAASEELKGKVVNEVQKGYYLNDKIIRFAKVVVGA